MQWCHGWTLSWLPLFPRRRSYLMTKWKKLESIGKTGYIHFTSCIKSLKRGFLLTHAKQNFLLARAKLGFSLLNSSLMKLIRGAAHHHSPEGTEVDVRQIDHPRFLARSWISFLLKKLLRWREILKKSFFFHMLLQKVWKKLLSMRAS